MKKNINITIDEEIYNYFKSSGKPISTTINDFLINFIAPKKVDVEKEKKLIEVMKFGEELELTKEMAAETFEKLDTDASGMWQSFKERFEPTFNLFEYIEIREKFREKFK